MVALVDKLILRLSRHHYTFFLREAWLETLRRPGGIQRGDTLEALVFLTHLEEGDLSRVVKALLRVICPTHPLAPAFILQLLSRIALPSPRTIRKVMSLLDYRISHLSQPPSHTSLWTYRWPWRTSILTHSSSVPSDQSIFTSSSSSSSSSTLLRRRIKHVLREEEREAANIALVIAALTQRLAGTMILDMVHPSMVQSLHSLFLRPHHHPTLRLSSLLALEALSRTGQIKERISRWIPSLPKDLTTTLHSLQLQEPSSDPLLALALEWFLFHTWSIPRPLSLHHPYGRATIVLDPTLGIGRYGKYAMNGLSCRNDHGDLLTVVASSGVRESGRWYYEVTLCTTGIIQLGWIFSNSLRKLNAEHGIGVGDVGRSYGLDMHRRTIWYKSDRVRELQVSEGEITCRPGDIIGVLLDLEDPLPQCHFFWNGQGIEGAPQDSEQGDLDRFMGPLMMWKSFLSHLRLRHPRHQGTVSSPRSSIIHPAISLTTGQQVSCNFGLDPFQYPPSGPYQSLQDVCSLPSHLIDPPEPEDEVLSGAEDQRVCLVCYQGEGPARRLIQLNPCGHEGICSSCAKLCAGKCPWCRASFLL